MGGSGSPPESAAETVADARAYLAGAAFDAVYVQAGVQPVEGLAALRDVLGLMLPILTVNDLEGVREHLGGDDELEDASAVRAALEDLKAELGRVAHALNNPLAVITGNAQLGLELADALAVDESVTESLRNIAEAAGDLEDLFGEVAALRARVDGLLGRS